MGARLIELPTHSDRRGNLTVIEEAELPFEIKRAFWIWEVPHEGKRGGHANKTCYQFLVALSGGFTARADGEAYHLYSPRYGLFIEPMTWLKLSHFLPGSRCLVFASIPYERDDQIHDYEEFLRKKGKA